MLFRSLRRSNQNSWLWASRSRNCDPARRAEQHAGDQIRRILGTLVPSGVSSVDALAGKTGLRRLYGSPEEYHRMTAAAVESFAGNAISLGKDYPEPVSKGVPRTIRVTYRVRHADLGLDMSHVVRQAL